jgi:tetratricopeptide (TPR) repeat protein
VIGKSALCTCLLLAAAMAAMGQSLIKNTEKCKSADPDARIAGCTGLIQGGLLTKLLTSERLYAIYAYRGTAYSSKGDYDRAIQDFDQSVRLNPNDPGVYYVRGKAYLNKGDYDRAIQNFNQAVHLDPNYAPAFRDRGTAYRVKGNFDHAIQDLNEAIRLNPKDAGSYYDRGLTLFSKDDYDQAIEDYNETIRLNPNNAWTHYARGVAYFGKGDYDQAIQGYNEAIRLDPKFALAYERRGDAYFAQSNLTAAITDFEHAISVAPSSKGALFAVLMLHVIMKRQGHDDAQQLAPVAAAADLSKWPGPVFKLDMGQMTADEVMKAAASPGSFIEKWQVCDANYFTGEDALFHHQRATALTRLRAARDGCPKGAMEYIAALAELKRLGAMAAPAK